MKGFLKRNAAAITASALIHAAIAAAIAFSPVQAARHRLVSFDVSSMKQRKVPKVEDELKHEPPRPARDMPPPVKRPKRKEKKKKKTIDLTKVKPKPKPELKAPPLKIREQPRQAQPEGPPVRAVTGVTLSSVTTPGTSGGSWSVPLGNTTFGPPTPRDQRPKEIPKLPPRSPNQVDRLPVLVSKPEVKYPEDARRLGIEGKVVLKLDIDEHGRVTRVVLIKGLYPSIDKLVLESAKKMIFKPALSSGEPVPVRVRYSYVFDLEDEW